MNDYNLLLKYVYAIFIGVVGSMLLVMLFITFITIGTVEKLLPFIIGFNAALSGYDLINRTKNSLKYKRLWSLISGITMVIGVVLILNIGFYYNTGGYFVYAVDVLFLAFVGGVFSWMGAILAIKYLKLGMTK